MNAFLKKFIVSSILILVILISTAGFASAERAEPISIQILNVSDWHGQLDPISVTGVGNVGGAAVLSAYFQAERAANPNSITLTAGDAVGATPPISAFFEDEPTILAMNMMGFQVDTFGNHNFDAGIDRLQSQIDLADFQYVSANLQNRDANLTGVKDYEMFEFQGVNVAVIGITNPEAPELVFPGNFGTIVITDPVKAALKARNEARDAGADIIIVITHMGVTGFSNGQAYGPLIDFANGVTKENGNSKVDVIVGDHTDIQYSGVINGTLVYENRSKGLTYAKASLTVDAENHKILNKSLEFKTPLASAVTPDPAITAMLQPYRVALAAVFDTPIGVATDIFPRGGNIERVREVAIGNLLADSLRWRYGTQLALTNGGGIRNPLPSSYAPLDLTLRRPAAGYVAGPPYDLVIGDVFAVLPFGNSVITRTVTGAQLYAVLEHSVGAMPSANGRFGQISGFKFTYKLSNPVGSRILSVTLDDNTPILPDGTVYTFATNDFVNAGGDGYTMLVDGEGVTREVMADVLQAYIEHLGTITPVIEGRITQVP